MILNAPNPPKERINVAILGVTFKENVPDIRNSKVNDLAASLESFGAKVWIVDPLADAEEVYEEYGRKLSDWSVVPKCDALILAVPHDIFLKEFPLDRLIEKSTANRIVIDLKGKLPRDDAKRLDVRMWRL